MLDAGGTAADACVAMAAAMAVLSPMMTGPGGDAFLLYRDAATGASARWRARAGPAAGRPSRRCAPAGHADMPARGGEPVTVPGAVALWADAAAELGRLGLGDAARARARDRRARASRSPPSARACGGRRRRLLRRDAAAAAAFLPGGRAPREGELVRLADLARTLGTLAEEGPRAFYEGEIAERIVAAIARPAGSSSSRTWPRTARRGSSRSRRRLPRPRGARAAAADDRHRRADDPAGARARGPRRARPAVRRADPPRGRGRRGTRSPRCTSTSATPTSSTSRSTRCSRAPSPRRGSARRPAAAPATRPTCARSTPRATAAR